MKARHHSAILSFRMADFYEMFYEGAEGASRVLALTLSSRSKGGASEVPLAGVPVKAVSEYLRRLVQQGYRVAICEQVEDPKLAKGIVRREVVETITPGAAFADDLLDGARNNFLCAVHHLPVTVAGKGSRGGGAPEVTFGIAAADLSTGEFRLYSARANDVAPLLARLTPREVIRPTGAGDLPAGSSGVGAEGALVTEREAWEFDPSLAREELARHFKLLSLEGLGISEHDDAPVAAAGALLRYLRELQPAGLPHLARPVLERTGGSMPLDEMTRRNLELVESLRGAGSSGTLLDVLDRTLTPMGARLLRQWVLAPLTERAVIDARLDAVGALVAEPLARQALRSALDGVRDVERLASKAAASRATPRELGALGQSLARLPAVEQLMREVSDAGNAGALARVLAEWDGCADVASEIGTTLVDRPPLAIGDEDAIRAGVDSGLDELRMLRDGG